jgi:5S rRNA maturation endonuclease (ribonuclease M5)
VGDTTQFPYASRSLVPVKTEGGLLMGFSGRSQHAKCPKCSFYHSRYESCIDKNYEFAHMYNKWFHSGGMKKTRTLYGINEVCHTDKIAIVEGPSCVWKLYEVGIPAAAVLGKSFSSEQANILKRKGISKIFLLSDQDEAGQMFKKKFIEDWYTTFNISVTTLPQKDISDMSDEEIKQLKKKWDKI